MSEPLSVGATCPDFRIKTYLSEKKDFGEISFADLRAQGKWTILFFYPADFTFV